MSPLVLYDFEKGEWVSGSIGSTPTPSSWEMTKPWYTANVGHESALIDYTSHSGGTITGSGQTISGRRFTDTVIFASPNIHAADCIFEAGYFGIDTEGKEATGLVVEHSTIYGRHLKGDSGTLLLHNGSGTIRYCDVYDLEDGFKTSGPDKTFEYNHIHDLHQVPNEPHNDGIQIGSSQRLTIRRNWIEATDTSCIAMFQKDGTYSDVLIQENYLTGAGYLIYAGGTSGSNVQIIGNGFGSYTYGIVTELPPSGSYTWSGNFDYATGTPVNF